MGVVVVWAGQPSHARESWLAHASHLPNIPYLSCLLVLVPCLLLGAPSCSSLGGLSGPEARRTTSGASGCRGGLQCELRSQPLSPCLVPSCRSPARVFEYSCAPPPTAVPVPIFLPRPGSPMFLAAKTHNASKHRERSHHLLLALLWSKVLCGNSSESIFSFFLFFWPFGGWGGNPLMRERAGLLMLRISPIYHTCPAF